MAILTYRYLFKKRVDVPYLLSYLDVYENGVFAVSLPLQPKVQHGFAMHKLEQWLGKDNAGNIIIHGESVVVEREHLLDLSEVKF